MKKKQMVVGLCYIRTEPAVFKNGYRDYSYTTKPLVFDGFNGDGAISFHYPKGSLHASCFGAETKVLPKCFADGNWTLVTNVEIGVKTTLNEWRGKMIERIRPAGFDHVACGKPVKLISATRHHVVVQSQDKKMILDCRYAKPEDWRLV